MSSLRRAVLLACGLGLAAPAQVIAQSDAGDAAFQRGVTLQEAGRFGEAVKAYDEAIRQGADNSVAYNNRGAAYGALKEYDRAMPDFDRANELNSGYAEAYCNRGAVLGALGQYPRAIRDLNRAIGLDPSYPRAYNNLAWLLATADDAVVRDGRRAIELALKACKLSDCKEPSLLDTMAAAYARTGDFARAVDWQSKAMADPQHAKDFDTQMRLKLYLEGKPYPPN